MLHHSGSGNRLHDRVYANLSRLLSHDEITLHLFERKSRDVASHGVL